MNTWKTILGLGSPKTQIHLVAIQTTSHIHPQAHLSSSKLDGTLKHSLL